MISTGSSVSEELISCYHDLLRREYDKFVKSRGDITQSRLDPDEIKNICANYSLSVGYLEEMGLLIPMTKDRLKFHTQHMALIEKLVKVQPWPNLPPVPLEHDLVMSEDIEMPALEVGFDEFARLVEEKISRPGLPLVVDTNRLRKIVRVVWEALGIEKLYGFQADYSAEIIASLLGRSSKEVFSLAAPTGMGKTEAFIIPSLVYSLLVPEGGVKVLLIYPRKSLERDQLQKLVKALTKINKMLKEIGREKPLRLGIDDGDSFRDYDVVEKEIKKAKETTKKKSITFRGIICPICEEQGESAPGRIVWQLPINASKPILRCSKDSSHSFEYLTDVKQAIWNDPPDILITNIHTVNWRLMYRGSEKIFGGDELIGPRMVVLDEAHVYRGLFGGFVHYILRRISHRLEVNGLPRPVWVISSATLGDPKRFARELVGTDPDRIYHREYFIEGKDRSRGKRVQLHILLAPKPNGSGEWLLQQTLLIIAVWGLSTGRKFINFVDSVELTRRIWNLVVNVVMKRYGRGEQWRHLSPDFLRGLNNGSYNLRIDDLLSTPYSWLPLTYPLLRKHTNFNSSQLTTRLGDPDSYEKVGRDLWERLIEPLIVNKMLHEGNKVLRFHNSRLAKDQRYEIEEGLKKGDVVGVISTSTLEMGIDIGDVSVIVQYRPPPSMESYTQRIGRGGRNSSSLRVAMGVLVLTNNPNDLWYAYGDRFKKFITSKGRINVVKNNRRVERWSVIFSLMDVLTQKYGKKLDAPLRDLRNDLKRINNPEEGLTYISQRIRDISGLLTEKRNIDDIIHEISEILNLQSEKVEAYLREFIEDLNEVSNALVGYLRDLASEVLRSENTRLKLLQKATKEGRFMSEIANTLMKLQGDLLEIIERLSEIASDNVLLSYIEVKDASELENMINRLKKYVEIINETLIELQDYNIFLRGNTDKISKDILRTAISLYDDSMKFTLAFLVKELKEKLPRTRISPQLVEKLYEGMADIRMEVIDSKTNVPEVLTDLRDDLERLLVELKKPYNLIRKLVKEEDAEKYPQTIQTLLEEFSEAVLNMRGLPLIDTIISIVGKR